MGEPGRPPYDDDWYRARLDEMRPFLVRGCSISYAAEKSGLQQHQATFYVKYKLKDWFSEKVDRYRATPGELVNETVISLVEMVADKVRKKEPIDRNDIDILELTAKNHRSAQIFFTNRIEEVAANPEEVGKILDKIESDYGEVRSKAQEQMVANDPSIQNKR